jgi:glycerol-3-phosphate dehydrogenase (NAD+)
MYLQCDTRSIKPFLISICRGSAIARIVGENVKAFDEFDETVSMWVYEEMIEGRKLSEIINTEHENVKYLKGYKIPENVVGSSSC